MGLYGCPDVRLHFFVLCIFSLCWRPLHIFSSLIPPPLPPLSSLSDNDFPSISQWKWKQLEDNLYNPSKISIYLHLCPYMSDNNKWMFYTLKTNLSTGASDFWLLKDTTPTVASVFLCLTIPIYIHTCYNFFHLKALHPISLPTPSTEKLLKRIVGSFCLQMSCQSFLNLHQSGSCPDQSTETYLVTSAPIHGDVAKLNGKLLAFILFNILTRKSNRAHLVLSPDGANVAYSTSAGRGLGMWTTIMGNLLHTLLLLQNWFGKSMCGENTAFCLALTKPHPSTTLNQVFLISISTFSNLRNTQFLTVLTLSSTTQVILQDCELYSEWFSGPARFLTDFTLLIHSLKWLDPFLTACTSTSTCSPCSDQPHSYLALQWGL